MTFEIKEDFLLDGKPFKILSGAIHYFRVHPSDWEHSLFNLKALGFNTVETYVPWNAHETKEGVFNFEGILDLEKFIQTAADTGLYVILRPSPYICAEWEFGGLPAWLLEKNCRIRSSDPNYLEYVEKYYHVLLPKVTPFQMENGGPIIMMQVENEYGSYGEDKEYLQAMVTLMRNNGVTVPLFTSDGAWLATLRAGSMDEQDILSTGNFGSKGQLNFKNLTSFHQNNNKKWPLMCMEFWDGWFNRWGEPIVTRDPEELGEAVREVLMIGSINLYMFHGGTNFGFMNGCSARGTKDLPQVTSYDYGAPLDEQGNPTEKYTVIKNVIHEMFPDIVQTAPKVKSTIEKSSIQLTNKVALFEVLEEISERHTTKYPANMEYFEQYYGYMVYRTKFLKDATEERFRIIDGRDRAQIYLNKSYVTTQYQEEIGDDIQLALSRSENQVDILMENMGRVNYGHKLLADTQRKGIRTGVMMDLHFMLNWEQFSINFEKLDRIDFSKEWQKNNPAFYQYKFELDAVEDTFLDISKFGKGIALINGVNLGRFWEKGPYLTLYIPKALLKKGENELIIFETEGTYSETINLSSAPIVLDLSQEE
ncbi:glycoside hydrolase family 35 protein [Enterococcus alishanensis]|uniref:Beta-galactosidase n=1 Tax=Enterococcus alishanensis TaxID=1303817 RepID=A0ABS6TDP3_9ENTE|nr:beta-galactosidase family protein [Enterococcus alishanensis]MBV7390954.1 beta-galactosidase [Enterococcus alishanensis]